MSSGHKIKYSSSTRVNGSEQADVKASVKRELFAPLKKEGENNSTGDTEQKMADYKQLLADVFEKLPAEQILSQGIGNIETGVYSPRCIDKKYSFTLILKL